MRRVMGWIYASWVGFRILHEARGLVFHSGADRRRTYLVDPEVEVLDGRHEEVADGRLQRVGECHRRGSRRLERV